MGELSKDEKVAINFENILDTLSIPSQQECLDKILLILKKCELDDKKIKQDSYIAQTYTELLSEGIIDYEENVKYDIRKIILAYSIIFCVYNINQMNTIYEEKKHIALNTYNDIDNKDASKKLKNKFENSASKYILENNLLFYDDGDIRWKVTLFDKLGIELSRDYFKSDQGRKKFYECFDIPLLLNPTEKEEDIINFRKKYVNEKEIETLYEAICTGKETPSTFYMARCYFERKKGSDEEKKEYMKVACLEEEKDTWKISKEFFMSSKYYKDGIKRPFYGLDVDAYDYIPVSEETYQKLMGDTKDEKEYNIKIEIDHIREVPKEKFKYTVTKTIQYNLFTNFPETIYEPVYDATFRSITKNIFLGSPNEINILSSNKIYSFYSEYYSVLNGRLSTIQAAREECYWLSEKLYGINFFRKVVEYIAMGDGANVTNGEKVSTKIHLTSEFIELIDRLSEISIPEMQFFYWELYIESGYDIEGVLESIDLLDMDEIEDFCAREVKKYIANDDADAKTKFGDKYKRKYVMEYLEDYQNVQFIEELKKDINNIYSKPDIKFLEDKGNQKYINCICSDTALFFKYVENLSTINNFGMWEE